MMLPSERLERSMFFDQSTANPQSWRVANPLAGSLFVRDGSSLFVGNISAPAEITHSH